MNATRHPIPAVVRHELKQLGGTRRRCSRRLWRRTTEVRRVVDAAAALVTRHLGICAKRARHLRGLRRIVSGEFGRDDFPRRRLLFNPFFESSVDAMLRALGGDGTKLAEVAGAGSTDAVLHAGNHVQTDERRSLFRTHSL